MKVRFTGQKEQNPTEDKGIKVLYAPGKRTAFRLRWYLILFLVASPFVWFIGKLLLETLLIEAPALTFRPGTDIRAFDSGTVQHIAVTSGERVSAGQLLVSLDNPLLRERLEQFRDPVQHDHQLQSLTDRQEQLLRRQLRRSQERVERLSRLAETGSATQGELNAAERERDARESDLLTFEVTALERRRVIARQHQDDFRQLNDRHFLQSRLNRLDAKANGGGVVREIDVVEGENVGSGTLLMRLEQEAPMRIMVYLPPRHIDYAEVGQPLKIRFPDGEWHEATMNRAVTAAETIPNGLRSPFSAAEPGLVVEVATEGELPPRWQVHNLPLKARFPNRLMQLVNGG